MLFNRQDVVNHISEVAGPDAAQQAAQELPDQVDHEMHADQLRAYGVDPDDMVNQLGQQYAGQTSGGGYGDDAGYGDTNYPGSDS